MTTDQQATKQLKIFNTVTCVPACVVILCVLIVFKKIILNSTIVTPNTHTNNITDDKL